MTIGSPAPADDGVDSVSGEQLQRQDLSGQQHLRVAQEGRQGGGGVGLHRLVQEESGKRRCLPYNGVAKHIIGSLPTLKRFSVHFKGISGDKSCAIQ